jgi:hypothetical protein
LPPIHDANLTLRFFGDDLDPEYLTERLGCPPDDFSVKGDTATSESGATSVSATGRWLLRASDLYANDIEMQIAELLDTVTDDLTVWHDVTTRYQADMVVGLFMQAGNESFTLSPARSAHWPCAALPSTSTSTTTASPAEASSSLRHPGNVNRARPGPVSCCKPAIQSAKTPERKAGIWKPWNSFLNS